MFEIGKEYPYADIEFELNIEGSESEDYGREILGRNALWYNINNKDYWFILSSATNKKYYYKCVYIN